jgi:hypothetical protein
MKGYGGCRFEGSGCNIDINECVRGTAGCAKNAGCINSVGGYTCRCYYGYDGVPSSAFSSHLACGYCKRSQQFHAGMARLSHCCKEPPFLYAKSSMLIPRNPQEEKLLGDGQPWCYVRQFDPNKQRGTSKLHWHLGGTESPFPCSAVPVFGRLLFSTESAYFYIWPCDPQYASQRDGSDEIASCNTVKGITLRAQQYPLHICPLPPWYFTDEIQDVHKSASHDLLRR